MIPKLTGNQFRAGRALAGLTRDELANRAGLSRDVLRSWEVSSEGIVPAQYQMLCRAVEALEDAGVRSAIFSSLDVRIRRRAPSRMGLVALLARHAPLPRFGAGHPSN